MPGRGAFERGLVSLIFGLAATSAAAQSITVHQPDGSNDRIAEGRDFSAYVHGNRWDMSDAIDVATNESGNVINQVLPSASGTYKLTTTSADPGFYVNWSGIAGTNRLERGERFPIDTTVYSKLSLRMKHNAPGNEPLQVLYFADMPVVNGTWSYTNFIQIPPNEWITLNIDLNTAAQPGETALWPSLPQIKNLRIDPGVGIGTDFEFDWIRLYEPASDEVPSEYTVTWSSSGLGGQTIAIEVVDVHGTALEVATGINASANSYTVDMAAFPPGNYTYRLRASGGTTAVSPGAVTINEAPIANLTQPDIAGDESAEYALTEAGNAWGPFEAADVHSFGNVTDISYAGGVLSGTATSGDSGVVFNTPTFIDTSRYRMLSIDYELEGERSGEGSVFRLFWGPNSTTVHTSDDYIIQSGRNRYFVGDMNDVIADGPFTTGWWNGAINYFRFDPHEFPTNFEDRRFHLYSVKLAPLDSANPSFTFQWNASDSDDNATMAIYVDPDQDPNNGNEILVAQGLSENGADSYTWNASGVPPGEYYALMEADDGMNRTVHYATGPLLIGSSSGTDIEILEPHGGNDKIASGGDFATDVLGNPWDFDGDDDYMPILHANINGLSTNADGVLVGTATSPDPQFWLTHPDYFVAGTTNNGRLEPIDPDYYRYLVVKMRVSAPSDQFLQLFFLNNSGGFAAGNFGFSKVAVVPGGGWQIAVIDLWDPAGGSPNHWRDFDRIRGLRLDPVSNNAVGFEIDWARLVPATAQSNTTFDVEWDAAPLGADSLDLFATDIDGTAFLLAEDVAAQSGSAEVDLGLLTPGEWRIRAVAASGPSAESSAPIDVNAPPILTFLQPDASGDSRTDFASLEVANPWGGFDSGDFLDMRGIAGLNFVNGQAHGTLVGPNPNVRLNVGSGIDTTRYRMLSISYELSDPTDSGSKLQVFWNDANSGGEQLLVSPGLQTYTFGDLTSDLLSFPLDWKGHVYGFRVDPHLSGQSKSFTLAEIRLQQYDTLAGSFTLEWVMSDPDDVATIRLYADEDKDPGSGNEIYLGQLSGSAQNTFVWESTPGLQAGIYQIYADVDDGYNSNYFYASGPIKVLSDDIFSSGGFEP